MMEPVGPDNTAPRAFLAVGGQSVARQQIGLMLELGCERIIVLAQVIGAVILQLQQLVEPRGVQFHAISSARALSGLVTVADELIVLADGLLADPREAVRLLELGPGVVVQSAEAGVSAGFERLDLNLASGGAMRLPGRLIERLTELPGDADPVAALTRLALQAELPQRMLAKDNGPALGWVLVRDDAEALALEPSWLAARMPRQIDTTPATWFSALLARKLGPALLHMRRGSISLLLAALALAALGLVSGWLGWQVFGLVLCAIGVIVRQTGDVLETVERNALCLPPPRYAISPIYGWALDLILVLLAGWGTSVHAEISMLGQMFAPAMVVLTARLSQRILRTRWRGWFGDRAVIALVFAAALVSGQGAVIWQVGAVLLALVVIAWPDPTRLTSP